MRRSLPATIVVVVGLLLLADFVVINPSLIGVSELILRLLVLLAAAAALAGGAALVVRHASELFGQPRDAAGSIVLLAGFAAMLAAGFHPGSTGTDGAAVRWLVAALLAPLAASLFAMLFFFLLGAMGRGMTLRTRPMAVMLASAAIAVVLLLPVTGAVGDWLAAAASWSMAVPIGGAFRGLLIGIGIVTAIHAARVLLSVESPDD